MRTLAILLLIGCGDSGGTQNADAAIDRPDAPGFDAPLGDATFADAPPPGLMVSNGAGGRIPADESCNGTRVDPPGANAEFTVGGSVLDFQTGQPEVGATIESSIDAVTAYDSKVTDSNGQFTGLRIPANHYRVSFHTTAPPDQVETWEIGIPVPPGTTTMQRASVSGFTERGIPGLVGFNSDMTKAIAVGKLRDCQGRTIGGAIVTITNTPDSQVFYFSDQGLPVRKVLQMVTNLDGLSVGVNLNPQTSATIQAIDPTTSAVVSSVAAPLVAGGFTIVEMPPRGP